MNLRKRNKVASYKSSQDFVYQYKESSPQSISSKGFAQKLEKFSKNIRQKKVQTVVADILEIQKLLQTNSRKNMLDELNPQQARQSFFVFLLRNQFQKGWVESFFKLMQKKIKMSQNATPVFLEEDYYKLLNLISSLPKGPSLQLIHLMQIHQNMFHVRRAFQYKYQCLTLLEDLLFKQKPLNTHKINNTIDLHKLIMPKTGQFEKLYENQLYYSVLKKKCLMLLNEDLSFEQDQILSQKIAELLKGYKNKLEQSQLKKFLNYQKKRQFTLRIKEEYELMIDQQQDSMLEQSLQSVSNNHLSQVLKILKSRLVTTMKKDHALSLLMILARNQIQTTQKEKEALICFTTVLSDRIKNEQPTNIKYNTVMNLITILNYLGLNQSHRQFREKYKDSLDLFKPILLINHKELVSLLQKQSQVSKLLDICNSILQKTKNSILNVKQQEKKLKVIKCWCTISSKYFQNFSFKRNKKPTINAIQQFKDIIQNALYPHNSIYDHVKDLQAEAKNINLGISRFLDRTKYQDLQFYEELRLFKSKMTYDEAKELKKKMKESRLDVQSQMQYLDEEIKQFEKYSQQQIQQHIKNCNLAQLLNIKKKLLENPIRSDREEVYQEVVRNIYICRAKSRDFIINRKEIINMLNIGGTQTLIILEKIQKMPQLLKAYKVIQMAEKQTLSVNRLDKNLLQMADQRKILQELQLDESMRNYIVKIYSRVKIIRQRFQKLKQVRSTEQSFKALYQQLQRYPISCRDIGENITKMRKQNQNLLFRLRHLSLQDRVKRDEQFDKYKYNGIRQSTLEDYLQEYQAYKEIFRNIPSSASIQSFKNSINMYQKNPSVASLSQFVHMRYTYFLKMQAMFQTLRGLGQYQLRTLIMKEGCQLIKIKAFKKEAQEILEYLLELSKKNQQASEELSQSDDINSQSDMSQDDDENMLQDLQDSDEDEEEDKIAEPKRMYQVVDLEDQEQDDQN